MRRGISDEVISSTATVFSMPEVQAKLTVYKFGWVRSFTDGEIFYYRYTIIGLNARAVTRWSRKPRNAKTSHVDF